MRAAEKFGNEDFQSEGLWGLVVEEALDEGLDEEAEKLLKAREAKQRREEKLLADLDKLGLPAAPPAAAAPAPPGAHELHGALRHRAAAADALLVVRSGRQPGGAASPEALAAAPVDTEQCQRRWR